jgi:hypothetical protein
MLPCPAPPACAACRIEERAAAEPEGEEEQLALRKLGRRLASVHEELTAYQQIIEKFRWG